MSEGKNRKILYEILQDVEDFAKLKNINYPPIYLLGGSACIIAGYLDRATTDIDLLDMNYDASMGRLLRIMEKYDFLDLYLTTIPMDFKNRARKIDKFKNIYVLSREDIILSKVGRYSEIDIEDISIMIKSADKKLLANLIEKVMTRENLSERVKQVFSQNISLFRERFDV
ncbi:MAG: hypothetical protein GYA02_13730 [Clostridiaceae bacterium]|nr:hypothetical protein [Clostridiaceae bacterium]